MFGYDQVMTALRADGYNGSVEFDGEKVTVLRENWRGKVGHGKVPRATPLADIVRVDFKEPTKLVNGHIRFAVPGLEDKQVSNDKLCVVFLRKQLSEFAAVRSAVEIALTERGELSAERTAEIRETVYQESAAKVQELTRPMATAIYAGHIVDYKGYRYGLGIKRDIAGAKAEFESGADRTRPTLTRIGAGALLAGPVGAIAGGMFKKDRTKVYVTIVFPDGATVIVDGPAKDEKKLRQFAGSVNSISATESRRSAPDQYLT